MKHEIATAAAWVLPLTNYLSWLVASGKPKSTIYLYGYQLRRFAAESLLDPFEVTTLDLARWLGSHATWSPGTQKSFRTSLKSFYQWAFHTEQIPKDPTERLPSVAVPLSPRRVAPEAAITIGLSAVDERVRLMVRLASKNGLRCCEIAAAHKRDVFSDLVGWSMHVHGKGRKERIVPLSDETAGMIRARPDGYLFPGAIDGHLSAGWVSKLISRAMPETVTAHPMRRRYATVAFHKGGKNIKAVAKLLGHSSIATTEIYIDIEDDAVRQAGLAAA